MTMEILERIMKENNIPKDVQLMSDSGWECDPTEMDGIFYNRQSNTIVFTQGGLTERRYEESEEWEILYIPDLVKLEEIEVYPVTSVMSFGLTEEFKKALKEAGDFEQYYGITESEDKYVEIDLRWRQLFYSIRIKGQFIGYIGFHDEDNALEPEIYIFKQYRNNGYGTRVLKRFVDMAFKEGLLKIRREESETPPPVYSFKREMVFPEKLVSTVRVENEFSKKMMSSCGFHENKEKIAEFLLFMDNEGTEQGFVQICEFTITKDEYMRRMENELLHQ